MAPRDPTSLRTWLFALAAGSAVAMSCILAAVLTNGSLWRAWHSPRWLLLAAGASGGALVVCRHAARALESRPGAPGDSCDGRWRAVGRALATAKIVLGVQVVACVTGATYAWMPELAPIGVWVIVRGSDRRGSTASAQQRA